MTDWPITAFRRVRTPSPPEVPFALTLRGPKGLVLHALNPAARTLGLHLGQSHADACAIAPELVSAPADPEAAAGAMHRLALWMERFTPFVTLDPSESGLEGLFLDLTGGQHLFGGEAAMAKAILDSLHRLEVPASLGVADTPGAAWALARYGGGCDIAPPGETAQVLRPLPVSALRISAGATKLLYRFGLRRIGDLARIPRAALARRFRDAEALNVLVRLDQALGNLAEPLSPVAAPATFRVQAIFAEPMTATPRLTIEAEALAARLCEALERGGRGARRLRLTGFRVDGAAPTLEVALARPSRKPAHLVRLMNDKGLERLDLGFGIDALALSAPMAEPLIARQSNAYGDERRDWAMARDALVDRLSARLGDEAVLAPVQRESWIPERSERLEPFGRAGEASGAPDEGPIGERPILLFDPPEPIEAMAELPDGAPARFVWRKASRRVARASGPERLAPEWWRETGDRPERRTRDYYRIEDERGGRYWVFREGLYAPVDPTRPPSWWMHGLFP